MAEKQRNLKGAGTHSWSEYLDDEIAITEENRGNMATDSVPLPSSEQQAAPQSSARTPATPKPRAHMIRVSHTSGAKVTVVDETSVSDQISEVIRGNLEKNLDASIFGEEGSDGSRSEGFHVVNVNTEIMKHKHVLDMMRRMGMCTCERCQADVLALTLSLLPSKYCVMYDRNASPTVSRYEVRHRNEIDNAIMKACTTVRDHPHHPGKERAQV
ncbi:MAG: late competence development ComFB family protein [Eubacterium sp.]|nr:late competence development ComFB family protein [Eubacterium sp.]